MINKKRKKQMKLQHILNAVSFTGFVFGMILFLLNYVNPGLILIYISLLLLPAIRLLRKFEKNTIVSWDYVAASLQWISYILIPLSLKFPALWIAFIVFFSLSIYVASRHTKFSSMSIF